MPTSIRPSRRIGAAFLLNALAIACWAICVPQAHAAPRSQCSDQVQYLSDTDDGYRYLEGRQRAIYTAFPDLADPFARAELTTPNSIQTISDLFDRLARQGCDSEGKNCVGDAALSHQILDFMRCEPLPTRFESPLFYAFVVLYSGELEPAVSRYGSPAEAVRFGSLPTGSVDARALQPPGVKHPIIIINRDLFAFTGAFSKAVSAAIPIREENGAVAIDYHPDAIAQRLRENPEIVADFADAMTRLVLNGSPKGAEEHLLDANHNRLHARLVRTIDLFFTAHEEAHILLRHVGPVQATTFSDADTTPASSQDTTLILQERTRAQEFEADALGYRLTLETLASENDPVALFVGACAPAVAFRIMDAANTYSALAGLGRRFGDANHPAASDRIAAIDVLFQAAKAPGGLLSRSPDMRSAFEASIGALLVAADPIIRREIAAQSTHPS